MNNYEDDNQYLIKDWYILRIYFGYAHALRRNLQNEGFK